MKYAEKHIENAPTLTRSVFFAEQSDFVDKSGRWSKGYGIVKASLQAAARYAAAWDLVSGEGAVVFVGEVDEAVDFRGLLKPVDKVGHFRAGRSLDASDADVDDDDGHVWDSEVAFGTFPQTELDVSTVVEIVDTGTDRVPVE